MIVGGVSTLPSFPSSAAPAALASIGSGLVHAAAAGTHGDEPTMVVLFAAVAAVQAAAGLALLIDPRRAVLVGAASANLVAVAAWAASRTTGLPVIGSLQAQQAVGAQDLAAATLAAASAILALAALRRPVEGGGTAGLRRLGAAAAVVPIAVFGMAAPHDHGDHAHGDEQHAHGEEAGAAADHGDHGDHGHDEDGSLLAGADLEGATAAELEVAEALVADTRSALGGAFATTAEAQAAGYVWIGDGRRVGGYQHYVNHAMLADGRELDPAAVESLVYENTPDGPVLVSAMYLLETGSTMDDAPDVAGELLVWHDHQNLCWDPTGTRLAGVHVAGRCTPAGELRATAPMLHVWLDDHECGPFAGTEGHGAGGCDAHEH